MTGATGVFSVSAVPYLQSLGMFFTVSMFALGAGLLRVDAVDLAHAGASLLAVVPSLGGRLLDQLVRSRINGGVFPAIFFATLLLLGMYLTLSALR